MIHLGTASYHGRVNNHFDIPVIIGAFTSIADGLTIIGSDHPLEPAVSTFPFYESWHIDYTHCREATPVIIGNDVWIGQNVTIRQGAKIGDGAIIGATSFVIADVEPYAIVGGHPAKFIRHRFDPEVIKKLQRIEWWKWPDEVVRERIEDFKDASRFVEKYG